MFEVRAAAAAAGGDFEAAISHQEQAIHKARELAWNTQAMEGRLASYESGKVWLGDLFGS
jgi:hypothetical protein